MENNCCNTAGEVPTTRPLILLTEWNYNASKATEISSVLKSGISQGNRMWIYKVILIHWITSKCVIQMANLFSQLTTGIMKSCPIWWCKLRLQLRLNILTMPFENTNGISWKVVWKTFWMLFCTKTQRGTILNLYVVSHFSRGFSQCIQCVAF